MWDPFQWTNWCQACHLLSCHLINREFMVWVGVISPSVSHLSHITELPAICRFSVLTIIVVQIRHAACTEAGHASTKTPTYFYSIIDKYLVNIQHITAKMRWTLPQFPHLWKWPFYTDQYFYDMRINNLTVLFLFPDRRQRERDDPCFVHESFPGPRRRPAALRISARMGIGALQQDLPVKPWPAVQLWRAMYTRYTQQTQMLSQSFI